MARPCLRPARVAQRTATFSGAANSNSASFSAISKLFASSMKVARPVRVELTTYSFGGCRSIHLSYGRTVAFHGKAVESHSRENCYVLDYSNSCTACAPECFRHSHARPRAWLSCRVVFSWRVAFDFSLLPGS